MSEVFTVYRGAATAGLGNGPRAPYCQTLHRPGPDTEQEIIKLTINKSNKQSIKRTINQSNKYILVSKHSICASTC